MNKFLKIVLLSAFFSSVAYADGCCRPILCCPFGIHPFIGLEENYTWVQTDGFEANLLSTGDVIRSRNEWSGWGNRIYAGLLKQVCGPVGLSAEIAYGTYGTTSFRPRALPNFENLTDLRFESSQTGFDILVGVAFVRPCYDLFLKAGGLAQRSKMNFDQPTNSGNNDFVTIKDSQTKFLPEVKLGGSYHITCNLAVTAAWTHAFGSDTKLHVDINNDPDDFELSVARVKLRNPTQDTVSLGLLYCI